MDIGNYTDVQEDRIQFATSRHSAKLINTVIYSHTISIYVCISCMDRYMYVSIYTYTYMYV